MSAVHSTPSVERRRNQASPNKTVAAGLRELADFLDEHPELPEFHAAAWISRFRSGRSDPRGELTALADALGEQAKETRDRLEVRVRGEFGPVSVWAEATVHELRGEATPEPEYEPIIARADS